MSNSLPVIIQGGMGIAVSNWELAKTVSMQGQLGVVSGTAIDNVMARRLQDGDLSGNTRRALAHFPNQEVVARILAKYFVEGGKAADAPYVMVPKITLEQKRDAQEILIAANFVEVWLAKEGHDGLIAVSAAGPPITSTGTEPTSNFAILRISFGSSRGIPAPMIM